jgi:hypothetical protein
MKSRILALALMVAALCAPAAAQFQSTAATAAANCQFAPGLGIDSVGNLFGCGPGTGRTWIGQANATLVFINKTFDTAGTGNVFKSNGTTLTNTTGLLGAYQGTTATSVTTGNFTPLTGPTTQKIPASAANAANKTVVVEYGGVYTNAAASLLNSQVSLCTVSGCGSGTVVSPAGCVVTTTNQANNLTNGQFKTRCTFITATTGAAGTLMASSVGSYNLGAATSAVLSSFADTATAVSAAVDLTVDEFVQPQFKFTTGNAGNSVTLMYLTVHISG